MKIGFCLSSEQFAPKELVSQAVYAEKSGFCGLMISDHLQPWVPSQGHSGHAFTILGAVGQACGLPISTGVSAPGERMHPVILAQAAATLADMFPGRFTLGLGAGEALNEHVFGSYWPEPKDRVQRLLEAVDIIRRLWKGEEVRFKGTYFKTESVRLYSLPEALPKLMIATSGPYLSGKTGALADGLLTVWQSQEKLKNITGKFYEGAASVKAAENKAKFTRLQLHISWDKALEEAQNNAVKYWPNGGLNFSKGDIRTPEVMAEAAKMVRPEHFENRVIITEKPSDILDVFKTAEGLGFDEVYVHCCGLNQREFMDMFKSEILEAYRY